MSCIQESLLAYDERIKQLEEEKKELILKYYHERLDYMEQTTKEDAKYLDASITGFNEQALEMLKNMDLVTRMTKDKDMIDIRFHAWQQYERMKKEISLFHSVIDKFQRVYYSFK